MESKKLKILQINKFHYLRGGAERYYLALSDLLMEKGHEVIYFSMKHPKNIDSKYSKYFAEQVSMNKVSFKNVIKIFHNFDAIKKLEKLLDIEKPNVVHLHNIYHHLSPAIIKVIKKRNIPMVMTLHDYKIICPDYLMLKNGKPCNDCKGGKYYKCLFSKCVKNSYIKSFIAMLEAYYHNTFLKTYQAVDLFIAPSRFIRDKMIEFGVPASKIKVVKHFIDSNQHGDYSRELGDYILYLGRISKEKGYEVLLDAVNQVDDAIKIKIAGTGPEEARMIETIKTMQLESRVQALGFISGDILERTIQQAKALVVPSICYEVLGLSALEAMSYEKVVIASDIGGLPELIKDRETGFLFEPGSATDLAKVINDLDQYDLSKMGKKARIFSQTLNKENHYHDIINIYKRVML